jgi:phenylacetate-CoA ligase
LLNRLLCSCALPLLSATTTSNFWELYRRLRHNSARDLYSPPDDDVFRRVKALAEHAYAHVSFYRERMDSTTGSPAAWTNWEDLWRLPPTTKSDILVNFPDRITANGDAHLYKPWRYLSTSGTIERMTVIHDFRKRDVTRASNLLALNAATGYEPGMRYLEIPPDVCRNVCGGAAQVDPTIFRFLLDRLRQRSLLTSDTFSDLRGLLERQVFYNSLVLPSYWSDGLAQKPEVLDECLRRINDYRPYVVKALPIFLYVLALHIQEKRCKAPRIPGGLMPMGSSTTPRMKAVIESAFDCPVHEDYGCSEVGAIAAECGNRNGLHPFTGLVYLEVVRDGRPATGGQLGRVLITDLFNYAMPLIRYDIGDIGLLRERPCPCGVRKPHLELHGRIQDTVLAPDGRILTPDEITDAILGPDVLAFQLEVRDRGALDLQIVPRNGHMPDLDRVSKSLLDFMGPGSPETAPDPAPALCPPQTTQAASLDATGPRARPAACGWKLKARVVPTIRPEAGGKYRFVKNISNSARPAF